MNACSYNHKYVEFFVLEVYYLSHSTLILTEFLKVNKYRIFSLRVLLLSTISCKSPFVRVINKLSTRLKTSISLGIL